MSARMRPGLPRAAALGLVTLLVATATATVPACAGGGESVATSADDASDTSTGQPLPDAASDSPATRDASFDAAPDPRAAEFHERADDLAATMMLRYWSALRTATNDSYWTYANDWDVVLDAVERHGEARYLGAARMFYEIQNARGWSRDFYDDENWMALTLMRAYDVLHDPQYLQRAVDLFLDIQSAWDETCCGAQKGGIWWRTLHDSKVTAINGGAIITAVRLYEHTKEASYLAFAKKVYAFWSANMVDPATGHVYDHIIAAGDVNTTWSFTYNEGVMIGAAVALASATGESSYLDAAHRFAAYMLAKESAQTPSGTILSDGKCGRPGGDDGEQFKGIGARYLALLYEADRSHTEYRDFLVRSSDAIWNAARDPATGLVSCDWAGPYDANTNSVNSLSSAAMTVAVTARILGPAPSTPLVFQAEEGHLHGAVGLEGPMPAFTVSATSQDGRATVSRSTSCSTCRRQAPSTPSCVTRPEMPRAASCRSTARPYRTTSPSLRRATTTRIRRSRPR
jgi:predicted alpha-1,6-mannanase (GH76 family)